MRTGQATPTIRKKVPKDTQGTAKKHEGQSLKKSQTWTPQGE
jgi:hypothetical protein